MLTQQAGADGGNKDPTANSPAPATGGSSTADVPPPAVAGAVSPSVAGSAALAHLGIASHSLQRDTNTVTAELRSPVGTPTWNDELGNQLTWMTHQGLESASLRLSPEHLGPVEVRISVQNGDASVWFGAAQADTRSALENALPHLRQMFANQGLTLTDSGVSREPPRNQPKSGSSLAAVSAVAGGETPVSAAVRLSHGLVDTYA